VPGTWTGNCFLSFSRSRTRPVSIRKIDISANGVHARETLPNVSGACDVGPVASIAFAASASAAWAASSGGRRRAWAASRSGRAHDRLRLPVLEEHGRHAQREDAAADVVMVHVASLRRVFEGVTRAAGRRPVGHGRATAAVLSLLVPLYMVAACVPGGRRCRCAVPWRRRRVVRLSVLLAVNEATWTMTDIGGGIFSLGVTAVFSSTWQPKTIMPPDQNETLPTPAAAPRWTPPTPPRPRPRKAMLATGPTSQAPLTFGSVSLAWTRSR